MSRKKHYTSIEFQTRLKACIDDSGLGGKHDKDKRKERESLSRYSRVGFREGNEV